MPHAKSLRVIGQSLERAGIETFEVEKHGQQYLIWTDALTEEGEWTLRNVLGRNKVLSQGARPSKDKRRAFCFSPADISRLDAQAQKKRRKQSRPGTPPPKILSQGLRALGNHLDRMLAHAFRIEWTSGSVTLNYQRGNGQRDSRMFTAEEVQNLCLHPRLRGSSPQLFPKLDV